MMGTRLLFRVWLVWMGRTKRERGMRYAETGWRYNREREVSFATWISCGSNRPTVFATTTDNLN